MRALQSPFAPVLAEWGAALPVQFREQFLLAVDAPYEVVLEGRMDEVWHRPAWLKPLFWLLALVDVLFPDVGRDVPAAMVISGSRDAQHYPCHAWKRTFAFPTPRRFNAIMTVNPAAGCVVEQMGPGGMLEMAWEVAFQPPDQMHIQTRGCALRLGRWRLPLLSWMYPEVRAIERAVPEGSAQIHIDLTVSHPWLGAIFGYHGTFTLRREEKNEQQRG